MGKGAEATEISLEPIEDSSSGNSSLDRPSRTDPYSTSTYTNNNVNRASNYSYPQRPAGLTHHQQYSYVDDTPGASPPGTPLTGGGGATPYGSLLPPRYASYANSNDHSRSSSPFPPSQTAFVSLPNPSIVIITNPRPAKSRHSATSLSRDLVHFL